MFDSTSLVIYKPYVRFHEPGTLCFTTVLYTARTVASLTADPLWELEILRFTMVLCTTYTLASLTADPLWELEIQCFTVVLCNCTCERVRG